MTTPRGENTILTVAAEAVVATSRANTQEDSRDSSGRDSAVEAEEVSGGSGLTRFD